jgi:hypothetical protein
MRSSLFLIFLYFLFSIFCRLSARSRAESVTFFRFLGLSLFDKLNEARV